MGELNNKIDDRTRAEKQLIYLLLHYKNIISDFIELRLSEDIFSEEHKYLVTAILEAYEKNNVLLTRESFDVYKQKFPTNIRIAADISYSSCYSACAKIDNFHLLVDELLKIKIKHELNSAVSKCVSDVKSNSSLVDAVKKLRDDCDEILAGSEKGKVDTSFYDSIVSLTSERVDYIEKMRRGEIEEEPIILTGIKEIDDTMVTGLERGTLHMFCSDVGSYKCLPENTLIYFADGSRKTVKELYQMQENGEEIPQLLSLNDNRKIINQNLLKVVSTGVKPCVKIKTSKGFEIENTPEHRHLLLDGYKETKDIKVGDSLAISRVQHFGDVEPLDGLATWLGCMVSDGGCSQIGYKFTNFDDIIVDSMKKNTESIGGYLTKQGIYSGVERKGQYYVNSTRTYGIEYGIDGKTALQKSIPEQVFSWNKESIIEFLQAMFGCDGSFITDKKKRKNGKITYRYIIQYHTSSYDLAKDVRDILIKFGIIATIYEYDSSYKNSNGEKIEKGKTYRVTVQDSFQVEKFIREIGFLGEKQGKAEICLENISSTKKNPNKDLIPEAIWEILDKKFEEHSKSFYGCRRYLRDGIDKGDKEGHCGNRGKGISRELLIKIAEYLDDDEYLLSIANSDIFWDKIVSIEKSGSCNVYDISMPVHHNFIANNIITHNSAIMLNMALNVWESGNDVLFVPLEMTREQIWRRMCARQTRIDSKILTRGLKNLSDEYMNRIYQMQKDERERKSRFFIMEKPGRVSVPTIEREIRKHIEWFKPKVVVIDYVANLQAHVDRRGRNDLEIGDMLKDMRNMGKELGFAVISAAQLGREALKRLRKGGSTKETATINSEDIRGSHEYSADADSIYAMMKSVQQPGSRLHIFCVKSRNGTTYFDGDNQKTRATLHVLPQYGLVYSGENMSADVDEGQLERIREATEAMADDIVMKDDSDSFFEEGKEWDAFMGGESTDEDYESDEFDCISNDEINSALDKVDSDGDNNLGFDF